MSNFKKIALLVLLAALAVSSPYLIAKYKAVNYASGQVQLPGTEVEAKPENMQDSMISPEGSETLTVKKEVGEGTVNYLITTTNGLSYTKTLAGGGSLSIPFNTWSPDKKYVFLKEDGEKSNYYVFSASGKTFADGVSYLNVGEVFGKKVEEFKLLEATGWASPTLLVVNTTTQTGENGPSFWFDITNQSFIRLSSKF